MYGELNNQLKIKRNKATRDVQKVRKIKNKLKLESTNKKKKVIHHFFVRQVHSIKKKTAHQKI